jgi:hypothetical protein
MCVMRTRSEPADQKLLAETLAPPDLGDGIESLGYWRSRRRRLPWYRRHARREAERMTIRWEQRVGAALVAQRNATPGLRVSGGLLLAKSRLGRWMRRARIALIVTVVLSAALMAGAAAAAIAVLIRAF